jgi:hypothetical protein
MTSKYNGRLLKFFLLGFLSHAVNFPSNYARSIWGHFTSTRSIPITVKNLSLPKKDF